MKVVIISTAYPLRGGIAHYVSLLYKHLSGRHEVSVITFKRQYPKILFPGKSQEEKGDASFQLPSIQVIDTLNPITWYKAGKIAADHKPDLIIFKYWMPFFAPAFGIAARVAKRKSGCKVLFICDNVLPHERMPLDKMLTTWLFKSGDYFVVQSKSVENDLLSVVDKPKYKFVPHPVYEIFGKTIKKSEARSKIGIRENENVALFFGYIRKYKGLHVLLDAMKEALTKIKLKLLVVGEFYDDEESYRHQMEKLELGDNVKVVGDYVPNDEVATYFSAADVVVLPYIDATQSGIAQIAYNFNKPVITTNVGGLAEIVIDGKTGLVVKPNSSEELSGAIVKIFSEHLSEKFAGAVSEQKKLYSWDNLINAIEELAKTGA
ncbi:MAG: glycosyltransferase [Bacteroidetes bacterium]|nr:glycosyltransferase [Bacteroidota bacterium]MCL5737694.1 glycosyltransferase [Bacteroidota bacterium]